MKKYGDVPWYSHVIEMDDTEELMRPRDSRLLIADSILADLDNAITHLELRKDVGNNRINKEAADNQLQYEYRNYRGEMEYVWPIPLHETDANPNLEQNELWK